MGKYELQIESSIVVSVEAETEEEAKEMAMQIEKHGERLLQEAYVSDVELIN